VRSIAQYTMVVLWLLESVAGAASQSDRPLRRSINQIGVHLSIEDSGTGVDRSNLNHIFKPMFTTKASGMGMDLSICRSIIENYNGRIWVTAGSERVSIFQFVVPAKCQS
jgi:signal transduction histidine kinase